VKELATTPTQVHVEERQFSPRSLAASFPNRIPFSESGASIAVDISGSTQGKVLSEEISAVRTICDQFSDEAKLRTHILPWNHKSHPVISPSEIYTLSSGGGTDPTVLNTNPNFRHTLLRSPFWFLLTDGLIEHGLIQDFALGIENEGLHGTACVIVLFGRMPARPVECNISVGLSVFAAAPDCLFLFHDVSTGRLRILQCKGCFNVFIPRECDNPILNEDTPWGHLPQMSYRDLARFYVPAPRKLEQGSLGLQDGRVVNLEDLYSNRLDATEVNDILNNDDNLKSVLLSAATRGQSDRVAKWVSAQKVQSDDPVYMERLDINSTAFKLTKRLLAEIMAAKTSNNLKKFRQQLREAHAANSQALANTSRFVDRRNEIVEDSITRLKELKPLRNPDSPCSNIWPVSPLERGAPSRQPNLLYTPGFKTTDPFDGCAGQCRLCEGTVRPLALLLMMPPTELRTAGFPASRSQSKLAYPLTMGNFPETHVIAPFVCCEACSYFVVRHRSAFGEQIVGALPLVNYDINRSLWVENINITLEERFARSDIEAVFLAMLYSSMDMAKSSNFGDSAQLLSALQWTIDNVLRNLSLPADLRASSIDSAMPLSFPLVLSQSLSDVQKMSCSFLIYPLEGFVVMIRAAEDLQVSTGASRKEYIIFQRLLFHLTERYWDYRQNETEATTLPQLLGKPAAAGQGSTAETSIPVSELSGGPLLDQDTVRIFRKFGNDFRWIEDSTGPAISVFLHYLVPTPIHSTAAECFESIKSQPNLGALFLAPESIDAQAAAELVATMRC